MVSALHGNFPATHFRRHTSTTTPGPPVLKTAVRLLYPAGLCCKRCIAILSASSLRELEYCQSREGEKTVNSRRNSVETAKISVPLDELKQYLGIFVESWLVGRLQSLKVILRNNHS